MEGGDRASLQSFQHKVACTDSKRAADGRQLLAFLGGWGANAFEGNQALGSGDKGGKEGGEEMQCTRTMVGISSATYVLLSL